MKCLEIKTNRLALQNYDWTSLSLKELFFLFNSYLKEAENKEALGELKKMTLYLSDFGESRMKEEEVNGPREILEKIQNKLKKQGLDTEAVNQHENIRQMVGNDPLVRKYEMERLKYYYVILDFETEQCADWIYSNCDGMEFEFSGMKIDLRGVPSDLIIPKEPVEVCDTCEGFDSSGLKKKKIQKKHLDF